MLLRVAGGQGRGKVSVYQVQELALFDEPQSRSDQPETSCRDHSQGGSPGRLPEPFTDSAQTILGAFIDQAAAAGLIVPRRTIGMFAREIKHLLDEGCSPAQVAGGMAQMLRRRKVIPSLLANFVLEAQLPQAPQRRFGRGLTAAQIAANGQVPS
jgi:hypothetical protein